MRGRYNAPPLSTPPGPGDDHDLVRGNGFAQFIARLHHRQGLVVGNGRHAGGALLYALLGIGERLFERGFVTIMRQLALDALRELVELAAKPVLIAAHQIGDRGAPRC